MTERSRSPPSFTFAPATTAGPAGTLVSDLGHRHLTPKEIAKYILAKYDRQISLQSIYRWISRGIRGERLRATRVGGAYVVDAYDLECFFERLADPTGPSQVSARRQEQIERASARLRAMLGTHTDTNQ